MLKKVAFFALAMAVVLGSVGIASAAQNVANTSQKGSLLVYPLVMLSWMEPEDFPNYVEGPFETYISIANDNYLEVWVKCYWMDADQEVQDFVFRLTPNQPVWFKASDGSNSSGTVTVPPFMGQAGELKCWAVSDASGQYQLAFNHLYGSAFIVDGRGEITPTTGFEYNAWSFTARPGAGGPGVATYLGDKGFLPLTGQTGGYDACPQYLVENFIAYVDNEATTGEEFEPTLVLSPCKQDVRQDRLPTCTKAKFDVWNENETKYTGAHRCIKCWYEGELGEIDVPNVSKAGLPYSQQGFGYGKDKFSFRGLHTFMGRFRVTGVASSVCVKRFLRPDGTDVCVPPGQVDSPLIGVLWHEVQFPGGASFNIGNTPHGAGADGTGWIKWDWQGDTPEATGR